MSALPIIDIGPLRKNGVGEEARLIAEAIGAASRDFGFFYAEGHGIAESIFARLEAAAHKFFVLPEADKAAISMAHGGVAWRGWFPLGGELTSGLPDRKEGLYLGEELDAADPRVRAGWPLHGANLWPDGVPDLRSAVEAYLGQALEAARALMRGMALSLGLGADHFANGITNRPTLLFRIFRYPPENTPHEARQLFGVGEHSDYGLLTLLVQDAQGGLEVRAPDGRWIDVPPRSRALVINIGDLFERLTRGRFRSAPHRVINRSGQMRLSYPLFFDPDFSASIEPLPIAAGQTGGARWDGVDIHGAHGTYGDYLLGKISKVFPELAEGALEFRGGA